MANGQPAVMLVVWRQPGANIIATADRVRATLPQLQAAISQAIKLTVVLDRTTTFRASLQDVEKTLNLCAARRCVRVALSPQSARNIYLRRCCSALTDWHVRSHVPAELQP